MKIIKYENYQIIPTDEAFLIKPIRLLFNADRTKNKEKFLEQMSYMYHMVDPRSTYMKYPEEQRHNLVVKQEGLGEDFKPSDQLKEAMEVYRELTTTASMELLNSMRKAIKKIGDFLEEVDLTLVNEKGAPIYSVTSITSATDKIPVLAKKLIETEKIVAAEIEEVGRARGGNESLHLFENGFRKQ